MNDEHRVNELLRELREGPVLLAGSDDVEAQRTRLLPVLRARVRGIPAALAEQRRQRRRHWLLGSASSLAVAASLVLLLKPPTDGNAVPHGELALKLSPRGMNVAATQGGRSVTLDAPIAIAAKGELAVTAPAELLTSKGVQIELDSDTRVGLEALASKPSWSQLRLIDGKVRCAVPPLEDNESFSVLTPQVEVVVHGTEFTVEVVDAIEPHTCVHVSEGLVEVRHDAGIAFVSPGESWGCDLETEEVLNGEQSGTHAERVDEPQQVDEGRETKPHAAPEPRQLGEPEGTLAEEARLFSLALEAERRGDGQRARAFYLELLERYPDSPLALDARSGARRVQ